MTLNPNARSTPVRSATSAVVAASRRRAADPDPAWPVGLIVLVVLVIGGLVGGNTLLGGEGSDPGDGTLPARPEPNRTSSAATRSTSTRSRTTGSRRCRRRTASRTGTPTPSSSTRP